MEISRHPKTGPELKITDPEIRRLHHQRALDGESLEALKAQRFALTSQIISLEMKIAETQRKLHEAQVERLQASEDFRAAESQKAKAQEALGNQISQWLKEGKTTEWIQSKFK